MTKHGQVDLEEMRREKDRFAEETKRTDRLKLIEGKNVVRFLPPLAGQKSPFFRAFIHYLRNPAMPDKGGRPVICPLKTRSAPCVICQRISELRRTGVPTDTDEAKQLSAGRRMYANVVNLNEPDKGVQVMEFGAKIYTELLSHLAGEDEAAVGDFTDPDKGYNVVIERVGTGKEDTRYQVRMAKAPSAIAKRAWLGEMHDLAKVVEPMDDERIRALLEGRDPDVEFLPPPASGPAAAPPVDDEFAPPRSGSTR
jgi:hypothetical protein